MSAKLMTSAQLKHMCSLPILISSSQRRASGGCPHFSSSTVVILMSVLFVLVRSLLRGLELPLSGLYYHPYSCYC